MDNKLNRLSQEFKMIKVACFVNIFRPITNIEFTKYDVVWSVYNLILPFVMISLLSDIINLIDHLILGFASILIVLSSMLFILLTQFKFLRPEFIRQMDPTNPFIYTYADFVWTCVHCCLFVFGDSTNYNAWLWAAFIANIGMLLFHSSR